MPSPPLIANPLLLMDFNTIKDKTREEQGRLRHKPVTNFDTSKEDFLLKSSFANVKSSLPIS